MVAALFEGILTDKYTAMPSDHTLFVGVDPSGGRKPFSLAAFDWQGALVALQDGELDEVLEFIVTQPSTIVAISAPPRPNKGLVRRQKMRRSLPPLHISGRSLDMRLAEHELRERGINVAMTPSRKELCTNWVQIGFHLFDRLKDLGFLPYPSRDTPHQWLETHPHAIFTALLEQIPLAKPTLEGRIQRQLTLFEQGLRIKDPMEFFEEITRHKLLKGILPVEQIYSPEELDAIAVAYLAFIAGHSPERLSRVGDPQEGQIFLPIAHLKDHY